MKFFEVLIGFTQQIVVYLSATVGKGLCSFRPRSGSGTRLNCLEIVGICNISPGLFGLGCTECRFADGWSKPHPYGVDEAFSINQLPGQRSGSAGSENRPTKR